MTDDDRSRINMSSIHVAGVGGVGMMVVAAVMVYVLPQLRLATLAGVTGGLLAGAALILYRRRTVSQAPPAPTLMVEGEQAEPEHVAQRNDQPLKLAPVAAAK
jgi:hypothetical protein